MWREVEPNGEQFKKSSVEVIHNRRFQRVGISVVRAAMIADMDIAPLDNPGEPLPDNIYKFPIPGLKPPTGLPEPPDLVA